MFPPFLFLYLGTIKVMVKLVAGYRSITEEGRKLEIASSAKLKLELTSDHRTETIYQDFDSNLYKYQDLAGQHVKFMDGSTMLLDLIK